MSRIKKFSISNQVDCKCVSCGSKSNLTLDHIFPKSKGGANHPANYQILCFDCNQKKDSIIDSRIRIVDTVTVGHLFDRQYNKNLDIKTLCNVLWSFFGKPLDNLQLITIADAKELDQYLSIYGIVPTTKPKVVKVVAEQSKKYMVKPDTKYQLSDITISKLVEMMGE